MRQETITINIYTFDELSDEAKEQAISDHIDFEIETAGDKDSYLQPAFDEAERLHTPWFLGSIIYEKFKDQIIETIKLNEYEFYANGKIY